MKLIEQCQKSLTARQRFCREKIWDSQLTALSAVLWVMPFFNMR